MQMTPLAATLSAIDTANAADPTTEGGRAAALLYGERMSVELAKLYPDASDILQIAARGQHIERWTLPRKDYPEGKAGYYAWRKEQGQRHAARVASLMAAAGYDAADQARVGVLLRKENLKSDQDVQALEDTICFTFIRWYLSDFAKTRSGDELTKIVSKTARKMSAYARARALDEFPMHDELARAFG